MSSIDRIDDVAASDRMSVAGTDQIVYENLTILKAKNAEYGESWKRRGGIGAFMMLARKMDRIETQAARVGNDLKKMLTSDTRQEGVIDDLRDLWGYLVLVDAEWFAPPKVCSTTTVGYEQLHHHWLHVEQGAAEQGYDISKIGSGAVLAHLRDLRRGILLAELALVRERGDFYQRLANATGKSREQVKREQRFEAWDGRTEHPAPFGFDADLDTAP